MRFILLLGFFLTPYLYAGQCSKPNFNLVSEQSTNKSSCPQPIGVVDQPVSITDNYAINCTYIAGSPQYDPNNPSTPYFSDTSTVTGFGQCSTITSLRCNPQMNMHTRTATDSSGLGAAGNNQFFNDATDESIGTPAQPCIAGTAREDFHQCQGQACASGGGNGGNCTPNPNNLQIGPVGLVIRQDPSDPPPPCTVSPILVDLSGKGFHMTDVEDGVVFDILSTGKPIQMAWTAPGVDNAFLALPASDGRVYSSNQLFGNYTPQPQSARPNGFLALAVYDKPENGGNGDGVIDAQDQIFSSLRLWIDENHDGICQPGELYRLADKGVSSIDLQYRQSQRTDEYGNVFRYRARINQGIHQEEVPVGRTAYDVFFVTR